MVNHTCGKFGDHKHRSSGDMVLVYNVISQDPVIRELGNIMGRSPSS